MIFETGNVIYSGWDSADVRVSMETLANGFVFTGNNRFINTAKMKAGNECTVYHPLGYKVVVGYIDTIEADVDGNIVLTGRDKSGDLVDCPVEGTGQLNGLTLKEAITRICEPFGITVSGEDGRTVAEFGYSITAPASEVIKELASRQGMQPNSDGIGGIVIQEKGAVNRASIILQEGKNILSKSKVKLAHDALATSYKVLGQSWNSNKPNSSFEGTAKRYRPKAYIQTQSSEFIDCEQTAEWIGRYSEGSSQTYTIMISELNYLKPNTLIETTSQALGVDSQDLLIRSVVYSMRQKDLTTTLTLSPPYIYGGNNVDNTFL